MQKIIGVLNIEGQVRPKNQIKDFELALMALFSLFTLLEKQIKRLGEIVFETSRETPEDQSKLGEVCKLNFKVPLLTDPPIGLDFRWSSARENTLELWRYDGEQWVHDNDIELENPDPEILAQAMSEVIEVELGVKALVAESQP